MNIDQYENKMIIALEGELSVSEYSDFLKEIESDEALLAIWKSYKELYRGMETTPNEIPSSIVKDRFYGWLSEQSDEPTKVITLPPHTDKEGGGFTSDAGINKRKKPIDIWRRWASIAAIFVCVFGFWKVYEHNDSVESTLADVSKQMEMLMKQQSSTARIKAIRVNYNTDIATVDDEMIKVLIDVINNDKSSNVRLAAVETLAFYMDQDLVREALIKRLLQESDGGVKLSIITSLSQQQDEKLKNTLEHIVNDDSQEKFVIDEAHMQLIRFDKIDI